MLQSQPTTLIPHAWQRFAPRRPTRGIGNSFRLLGIDIMRIIKGLVGHNPISGKKVTVDGDSPWRNAGRKILGACLLKRRTSPTPTGSTAPRNARPGIAEPGKSATSSFSAPERFGSTQGQNTGASTTRHTPSPLAQPSLTPDPMNQGPSGSEIDSAIRGTPNDGTPSNSGSRPRSEFLQNRNSPGASGLSARDVMREGESRSYPASEGLPPPGRPASPDVPSSVSPGSGFLAHVDAALESSTPADLPAVEGISGARRRPPHIVVPPRDRLDSATTLSPFEPRGGIPVPVSAVSTQFLTVPPSNIPQERTEPQRSEAGPSATSPRAGEDSLNLPSPSFLQRVEETLRQADNAMETETGRPAASSSSAPNDSSEFLDRIEKTIRQADEAMKQQ